MIRVRRKGAVIFDSPRGILVVSTGNKKYILPGGGADRSESRKDAGIRKLYEETGMKVTSIKYLFGYIGDVWHTHSGRAVRNDAKVFLVTAEGNPKPKHDIKSVAFWKPGSKINLSVTTKKAIDRYVSEFKS